jgi:hypothetical protein
MARVLMSVDLVSLLPPDHSNFVMFCRRAVAGGFLIQLTSTRSCGRQMSARINSSSSNSTLADENRFVLPSHEEVLDAFEKLTFYSVERGYRSEVLDYLHRRGFIEWGSSISDPTRGPTSNVAKMCGSGHAALDWLRSIERSPQWGDLKHLSYET